MDYKISLTLEVNDNVDMNGNEIILTNLDIQSILKEKFNSSTISVKEIKVLK